ncbi:MAG: site-specific integrase [Desulfobacteraceae bacterium]|nr:site-specific integrase [Desulfobacteraceae bacterium]
MALRFCKRVKQGITYYSYEIDGKRKSFGAEVSKNEAKCRQIYNELKRQYLAGKLADISSRCKTTLGELKKEHERLLSGVIPRSTFRANRLAIDKLIEVAGINTRLDQLNLRHIALIASKNKDLSKSSVNNYIRHARVVMGKAVEWGFVATNPILGAKQLRIPARPPLFIDKAEIAAFIASVDNVHLRRMVVAYLATGRRRSELVALKKSDVLLEEGRYRVIAKGNREQWFPINAMFKAVLLSCWDLPGERVFSKWSHPDTISHYIKKALVKAGLGHLHLHHLRHTFASIKATEGRSLKELMDLMGHAHINATMIYTHLTDNHLAEIAEVQFGPVDLE